MAWCDPFTRPRGNAPSVRIGISPGWVTTRDHQLQILATHTSVFQPTVFPTNRQEKKQLMDMVAGLKLDKKKNLCILFMYNITVYGSYMT